MESRNWKLHAGYETKERIIEDDAIDDAISVDTFKACGGKTRCHFHNQKYDKSPAECSCNLSSFGLGKSVAENFVHAFLDV